MQAKRTEGSRPVQDTDPFHEAHLADDSDGSVTYFATPHDNVLSTLYGRSQAEKGCVAENFTFPSRSDVDAAPDSGVDRRLSTSPTGFMRSTPSPRFWAVRSPSSFSPGSTAQRETLTDPYDGTTLGVLVPNTPCPTQEPASTSGEGQLGNEELWTHLSRITDLQTEVARMHLEMEGVGNGKGKGKGKSGENRQRRRRRSEVGVRQSQSDAGPEEYDGEGIEMDDEETEQDHAREEEFAKLADQFEGRKESVNNIMSKLDDLSKALTEFHTLQAPEIMAPSCRKDSNGVYDITPPNK